MGKEDGYTICGETNSGKLVILAQVRRVDLEPKGKKESPAKKPKN